MVTPGILSGLSHADKELHMYMFGWQLHGGDVTQRVHWQQKVDIIGKPDVIERLEIWVKNSLILSVPFAIGGGHWLWVPPYYEAQDE